jgi:hypothetical protein
VFAPAAQPGGVLMAAARACRRRRAYSAAREAGCPVRMAIHASSVRDAYTDRFAFREKTSPWRPSGEQPRWRRSRCRLCSTFSPSRRTWPKPSAGTRPDRLRLRRGVRIRAHRDPRRARPPAPAVKLSDGRCPREMTGDVSITGHLWWRVVRTDVGFVLASCPTSYVRARIPARKSRLPIGVHAGPQPGKCGRPTSTRHLQARTQCPAAIRDP